MNSWRIKAFSIAKFLIALVLVLNLTACGEKAVSQDTPIELPERPKITGKISEVAPPAVIQELRESLEKYQPQVTIVTPDSDEILSDKTVKVRFQVEDLPIFKDSQLQLGPHLHVILDNEPYRAVYDLNQPLVLSDLSPGTHTLRVFASRPWHESFKNEGAYAQTTFHVLTKTDDNNPDSALPLLTYSRPKGTYGAEPIMLDFYLTNAPLHLLAKDNPTDPIADWRIRCTINGESFILDRWEAIYLQGFEGGQNWIKLEFIDSQGNPVKNVFNSTVRAITYEPKGEDTLAKIVRGELSVEEVRAIVDPSYAVKIPPVEPTPTPTPTPTVEPTPETQPQEKAEKPTLREPAPETKPRELTQPEKPSALPTPSDDSTPPQVIESPAPEIVPSPQPEETPKAESPVLTAPSDDSTPPQVIESPAPEVVPSPQPEETPKAESQELSTIP